MLQGNRHLPAGHDESRRPSHCSESHRRLPSSSRGAQHQARSNRYAIKFTILRDRPSGSAGDGDIFGAQQYAPLLDVEIELDN
nr:DUF4387 family protein [Solirhodobacter olei]